MNSRHFVICHRETGRPSQPCCHSFAEAVQALYMMSTPNFDIRLSHNHAVVAAPRVSVRADQFDPRKGHQVLYIEMGYNGCTPDRLQAMGYTIGDTAPKVPVRPVAGLDELLTQSS